MMLPVPRAALDAVFASKYGDPAACRWGPRMRLRFSYFNPDDHYEALVSSLVQPDTCWLDVGCGRALLPNHDALAERLARRCKLLVGVDPDATLDENPFVHERVRAAFEGYDGGHRFDLITLRMVAEHVTEPERVLLAIARAARPGARAVVYTVNRLSPVPLLTTLVPFPLRHPVKRFLWRTEAKDTFPTAFRMNTRKKLRALFAAHGFAEEAFTRLDDCRTLSRFRLGLWCELTLRRLLHGYPEQCLLGVYRA